MNKDTPETLKASVKAQLPKLYSIPENFTVELMKYSENIIYKISFETGEPLVFRLRRPLYHSDEELESELIWAEELRKDAGVCVPEIYRGRNGGIMQLLNSETSGISYRCDLMSFMHGKVIGKEDGSISPDDMEKIGNITAKMHLQAQNRSKDIKLVRKRWDVEEFFGKNALWGNWRDYALVKDSDLPVLEQAEKLLCGSLEEYGRNDMTYGIIHADLHPFNIIADGDKFQIIDFDDCGFGFYLYDLGCTLVTCSKDLELLTQRWIKGYEQVRPLTEKDKRMLPAFVLLRRIIRLAWLSSHADSDTAKTVSPKYYDITLKLAKKFIKTEMSL